MFNQVKSFFLIAKEYEIFISCPFLLMKSIQIHRQAPSLYDPCSRLRVFDAGAAMTRKPAGVVCRVLFHYARVNSYSYGPLLAKLHL